MKAIDISKKTTGTAKDIKAKGYEAVGIYLRSDRCSKPMIKDLKDNGLKVWCVYEKGVPTSIDYFTAKKGADDAARAVAFAAEIGQPTGSYIYGAVDYDATAKEIDAGITDYMKAFQKIVKDAGYVTSIYGSGLTCRMLIEKKLAKAGWLSLSTGWAEYKKFKPNAAIVQLKEISADWDTNDIPDPKKAGLW